MMGKIGQCNSLHQVLLCLLAGDHLDTIHKGWNRAVSADINKEIANIEGQHCIAVKG